MHVCLKKVFEAKKDATCAGERERAFAFVLSFSIQNSVDKKLGFRQGEARTFYIHADPRHTHKHNGLISKILNGNHIFNDFSSTRCLRHYLAQKPMKISDGAISRAAKTQQRGNGSRTPAPIGPPLIMRVNWWCIAFLRMLLGGT
jgi:hypothetical protein